LTPFLDPVGCI